MKKTLAVIAALSFGAAYAQTGNMNIAGSGAQAPMNQRHMIEFNADNIPSLIFAFGKTKTKGTASDNDQDVNFQFNYAYAIHPNFQIGGRFNFFNGLSGNNDVEQLDLQVAGWFNFYGGDLQNSPYLSASFGGGYAQTFGAAGGRDDIITGTLALGKRFSMDAWGVKHLTWSPEIALTNTNSTNDSNFDYRHATEFRILKFSVIW